MKTKDKEESDPEEGELLESSKNNNAMVTNVGALSAQGSQGTVASKTPAFHDEEPSTSGATGRNNTELGKSWLLCRIL